MTVLRLAVPVVALLVATGAFIVGRMWLAGLAALVLGVSLLALRRRDERSDHDDRG